MSNRDEGPIDGLDGLYQDRSEPAGLEDAVVGRLRDEGLIGDRGVRPLHGSPAVGRPAPEDRPYRSSPPGSYRGARHLARAASVLLLVGAGWVGGRLTAEPALLESFDNQSAPAHMLLLWEDGDFDPGLPPDAVASEYAAWAAGVAQEGTLLSGHELAPARVYVGDRIEAASSDGFVGGYFIVRTNAEDATELAMNHPHVRYGGSIEVAPVVLR